MRQEKFQIYKWLETWPLKVLSERLAFLNEVNKFPYMKIDLLIEPEICLSAGSALSASDQRLLIAGHVGMGNESLDIT